MTEVTPGQFLGKAPQNFVNFLGEAGRDPRFQIKTLRKCREALVCRGKKGGSEQMVLGLKGSFFTDGR